MSAVESSSNEWMGKYPVLQGRSYVILTFLFYSHMKQYQRADNIHNFTTDPETKVLLLSMRAGAAGLNLMAANYCFLMDPATNAAVEEQAIDRIHRYVRVLFH